MQLIPQLLLYFLISLELSFQLLVVSFQFSQLPLEPLSSLVKLLVHIARGLMDKFLVGSFDLHEQ